MAEKTIKDESKKSTPFDDFIIPKGMSMNEYIQSEIRKAQAQIKAEIGKTRTNAIQLGVTVVDKDFRAGKEMVDRNTNQPLTDEFGEVKRYPTKYYVTFAFNGGSYNQEVKENDFNKLIVNKQYFAQGYMGEINEFGKTKTAPIFTTFDEILL